ncbi:hypothetical protein MK489_03865 [Myxococcota bacterium]|nr:hypothetical protein [Myxococcota bacterium]
MSVLWIIHRDPSLRAALARLARASEDTILGSPLDPIFDAAPPGDVVLLGLAELEGSFEPELEFVHRARQRLKGARWVLLPEAADAARAQTLFDTLDAEILIHPVDSPWLQASVKSALEPRKPPLASLSQRVMRDRLRERFGRWFQGRETPELLRALDPRLGDIPVCVQGEPGTGRGLWVRYLHDQLANARGPLVRMVCRSDSTPDSLLASLGAGPHPAQDTPTCWLDEVQALPRELQDEVLSWIELGLPTGTHAGRPLRWAATTRETTDSDGSLEPALRLALGGQWIRLAPLRDDRESILPFAQRTAQHWCEARQLPSPEFSSDACAALENHAWPGNHRQLEAVVTHSLVARSGGLLADGLLTAADLRLNGEPFVPTRGPRRAEAVPIVGESVVPLPREGEGVIDLAALIEDGAAEPLEPAANAPPEPLPLGALADALAHEIRNPLSSIRTFTQLLPQRFEDADFRARFEDLVGRDVDRILDVVERIDRLARWELDGRTPVDAATLVGRIVEERREETQRRRLEWLLEIDGDHPLALGNEPPLRFALECLIDEGMGLVPDGSRLFLASHYHPTGLSGGPSLRILMRCGDEGPTPVATANHSLSLALAQWVVRAGGGAFTLDAASQTGILMVVDLPAP